MTGILLTLAEGKLMSGEGNTATGLTQGGDALLCKCPSVVYQCMLKKRMSWRKNHTAVTDRPYRRFFFNERCRKEKQKESFFSTALCKGTPASQAHSNWCVAELVSQIWMAVAPCEDGRQRQKAAGIKFAGFPQISGKSIVWR